MTDETVKFSVGNFFSNIETTETKMEVSAAYLP